MSEFSSLDLTTPCVPAYNTQPDRYGQYTLRGAKFLAHRLVYEIAHGKIPEGLVVRHTCDNPSCVNPMHLVAGTHQDNMDDRNGRKRHAHGQGHGGAKLTDEDVRDIKRRLAAKQTGRSIAKLYGVHETLVSLIKRGRYWSHINE